MWAPRQPWRLRSRRLSCGATVDERAHNACCSASRVSARSILRSPLGVKAAEAGYRALFLTLGSPMTRLARAKHENRLERALQQLTYPRVLVLEMGYLPLSRDEASHFFGLLVRRYECASGPVRGGRGSSARSRRVENSSRPHVGIRRGDPAWYQIHRTERISVNLRSWRRPTSEERDDRFPAIDVRQRVRMVVLPVPPWASV